MIGSRGWRLWSGIFLGSIALAWAWATAAEAACDVATRIAAADDGRKVAYCLEFWLNRYQTLIGGVVAVCAAAAALFGVRGQIVQAQDQNDLLREQLSDARDAIAHVHSTAGLMAVVVAREIKERAQRTQRHLDATSRLPHDSKFGVEWNDSLIQNFLQTGPARVMAPFIDLITACRRFNDTYGSIRDLPLLKPKAEAYEMLEQVVRKARNTIEAAADYSMGKANEAALRDAEER